MRYNTNDIPVYEYTDELIWAVAGQMGMDPDNMDPDLIAGIEEYFWTTPEPMLHECLAYLDRY